MKLWLDDIREAPEGWKWVKCAEAAIQALKTGNVTEVSLDHDLSFNDYTGKISQGNLTGYDVVLWMEMYNVWPKKITVHSMNPVGRQRMAVVINRAKK